MNWLLQDTSYLKGPPFKGIRLQGIKPKEIRKGV